MISSRSSWVWLAAALTLVAAITVISAANKSTPSPLSTTSAQPDGALALSRWLGRIGYPVRAETGDLDLKSTETVWVLRPDTTISGPQAGKLLKWVRSGGRLVLASEGATGGQILKRMHAGVVFGTANDIHVVQPLLLAPPTSRLDTSTGGSVAVASRISSGVTVAASTSGPVIVLWRWGRGIVWLVTAPQLFQNDSLGRAENRRLALNLVGPPGTRITFDEFTGTSVTGPTSAVDTAWGTAVVFLIILLVLFRLFSGWRLGPPLPPLEKRARPAVEYVISMAGLLRRARSRSDVLAIYQRHLRRLLQRHSSPLGYGRGEKEIERLLAPSGPLSEAELVRRAEEIVRYSGELRRNRG